MKKPLIKKSCAAAITIAILLALVVLLRRDPKPAPSFQFLSSRGPAIRAKKPAGEAAYGRIHFVYSFKADFNDVCADADTELLALGYVNTTPTGQVPRYREYMFRKKLPDEFVTVRILDRHKFAVYSTPRRSDYASPDVHTYHSRIGWVSVEIIQSRRQSDLKRYLRYSSRKLLPKN